MAQNSPSSPRVKPMSSQVSADFGLVLADIGPNVVQFVHVGEFPDKYGTTRGGCVGCHRKSLFQLPSLRRKRKGGSLALGNILARRSRGWTGGRVMPMAPEISRDLANFIDLHGGFATSRAPSVQFRGVFPNGQSSDQFVRAMCPFSTKRGAGVSNNQSVNSRRRES